MALRFSLAVGITLCSLLDGGTPPRPARFDMPSTRVSAVLMRAVGAPAPPAVSAAPELASLTVYELKAICRAKGLKVSGRKVELVDRIRDSDVAAASALAAGRPAAALAPELRSITEAPIGLASRLATTAPREEVVHEGDVEVLSVEDSLELEVAARRAQRRRRLQQYYVEEVDNFGGMATPGSAGASEVAKQLFAPPYASEFNELRGKAGAAYARAMDSSHANVPIGLSGTSIQYATDGVRSLAELPALPAGSAGQATRLAWCREFAAEAGEGVLVDLLTESEFRVRRALLRVSDERIPEGERCLYRGEFVEYQLGSGELAAGRQRQQSVLRVQGIHGWPLMFEAAHMLQAEQQGRAEGARAGDQDGRPNAGGADARSQLAR